MNKIFIIAKNSLKRTFKKPSSYVMFIIIPVAVVIGIFMIFSASNDAEFKIGVCDLSDSVSSKYIIENIDSNDDYKTVVVGKNDVYDYVSNSKVSMVVYIDEDFETDILNNCDASITIKSAQENEQTAFLQNSINGDINNLFTMAAAFDYNLQEYYEAIELSIEGKALTVTTASVSDESLKKSASVEAVGMYLMLMMLNAFMLTSKILEEKRIGTYSRIGIAPVNAKVYSIANILSSLLIMFLQIILVLYVLTSISNVKFEVGIWSVFISLILFAICSVSIGVFVSTLAKTTHAANAAMTLIVTPTCMLSGCLWPLEFMPDYIQKLAYLMPQRWALDAMMYSDSLVPSVLVLIGFICLFFIASVFNTRRLTNA